MPTKSVGTYAPPAGRLLAVDMLVGHVQEFMLSPVGERGFPVSNNGNG